MVKRKKASKARRKQARQLNVEKYENDDKTPRSFVIRSGLVGTSVNALVKDFRKVMEPNTATRLKVSLPPTTFI
ncbi:hypothetical protein H4R33_005512 [Dimargaris cristalligena]|uniref:Brix domain-containing protein n=1 Tax=Dimargaris cristalligena TaxID=215637 RepID=A0A4P9ZJF4_9FUNG|nr:hypothetical protein H4R33_005512 [Dimargaris cristalligena]RKP33366.1 hypothetical protein BJ085DRAFT_40347 [Dimargaris cristalligena]|eukprot:RKP33366.1 hypothetical protein BJ085DRAFT_40347 [Dimargaris cristalligena]